MSNGNGTYQLGDFSKIDEIRPRDAISFIARYGIPLSSYITNAKRLRDLEKSGRLNFRFRPAEFMRGVVSDIPRPNLAPRYRLPSGSSLAEEVGGQRFADAQQRSNEAQFEMQNQLSKRQQESDILNRANAEEQYNNQLLNTTGFYNTQAALQQAGNLSFNRENALAGILKNANFDVYQGNMVDAMREANAFESDVRSDKMGGKIRRKTKFSYGAR